MLSPHPADPTLTTDNLMEVVKEVEHRWEDLGEELGLRTEERQLIGEVLIDVDEEVLIGLDGEEIHGMADVVKEYVRHYPTPSWKQFGTVLQRMELDQLAVEVTTKYVRGMDVNHVTCLIQTLKLSV